MNQNRMETLILEALSKTDSSELEARLTVYEAAHKAILRIAREKGYQDREELETKLTLAIERVEQHFSTQPPTNALEAPAAGEFPVFYELPHLMTDDPGSGIHNHGVQDDGIDPAFSSGAVNPHNSRQEPDMQSMVDPGYLSSEIATHDRHRDDRQKGLFAKALAWFSVGGNTATLGSDRLPQWLRGGFLRHRNLLFVCIATLVLFSMLLLVNHVSRNNEGIKTASQRTERTDELDTPELGETMLQVRFDDLSTFVDDASKYGQNISRLPNGDGVVVNGVGEFIGREMIPVNIENVYLMRLRLRYVGEVDWDNAGLFAGFETYNGAKELETQAPGTNRYFVAAGKLSDTNQEGDDGWINLWGIISGSARDHGSFRETTQFARPYILVNLNQPDQVVELHDILITKLDDSG